jgi:hypothetical protein
MRTTLLSLLVLAALASPLAALAAAPTPAATANQLCKQARTTLAASFATTYGTNADKSNAFGKCVSKNAKNAQAAVDNASKACATERAADATAFAAKYGSNGKKGSTGAGKDAFGKCVSMKVSQATTAAAAKAPSALKQCRAARKTDAAGFAGKYGSGADALGKCVSATAKA